MAAVLAMAVLTMTSCNDDDTPNYSTVTVTDGLFIVNAGNKSGGIDGSLTFFDYASAKASQGVYKAKNNASLGITANDAVVYGSKIYIVGSGENTVFVANSKTIAKVANISTGDNTPRHIVAGGGKVFVSAYGKENENGKVFAIDTLTNTITKTYEAGSYPEGINGVGEYLFVANSDYGNGQNPSISKININTGASELIKNDQIKNPSDILVYGSRVFYVDGGGYDANWNQSGQGVYELQSSGFSKKICETTMAAINTYYGIIYAINAPYTYPATTPQYIMYELSSNSTREFIDGKDIAYPALIKVDPLTNNVLITSYNIVDGKTSYKTPGYGMLYNSTGSKLTYKDESGATKDVRFETGVGPTGACFRYGTVTIQTN